MSTFLPALRHEFLRHKALAEGAIAQLDDGQFFARPAPQVNSPAIIVKHLAASMLSRWTDFLTSDGEKPGRDRDTEFSIGASDTRESLFARWQAAWEALHSSLDGLAETDFQRTVTIRGEPHTVVQALTRGLTHVAYHVGQILYVARLLRPDGEWQTIAPGKSNAPRPGYLSADREI